MRALIQKLPLIGLALIFTFSLFGQTSDMTWGNIPRSDLSMIVYPADSSAAAVVLADHGDLRVIAGVGATQTKYYLNRHRRIKLLNRQSFDTYGQMKLFFVHSDDRERIEELKAQTILPNGRKHEVSRRDIFKTKENEFVSSLSFAFPNLEEGAIVEIQYQLISTDVIEPRPWYFQEEIPVRHSQFSIKNESRVSYVTLFNGGEYYPERESVGKVTTYRNGETRIVYGPEFIVMENAPALEEEEFITTLEDYRAKVRLQGEFYYTPDGRKHQLFTTWEKSAKSLLDHPQFGQQFRKKRNFKKLLEEVQGLISPEMNSELIMKTIFSFINQRVTFNGKKSFWVEDNLNKAFTRKQGNAGEVNLMCLALLKAYDLDAFPILTSTRDHGKMYRHYPLIDQFNYVLVGVEIEEKIVLLDATDPLLGINMPSPNALNKLGWAVDLDHLSWIDIQVPMCRDIYGSELSIDEEGNVVGKMRAIFNSYTSLAERQRHKSDPSGAYWKNRMGAFASDIRLESVQIQDYGEASSKFMSEIRFEVPNGAMAAGDYLYLSPIYYSNFKENPFQLEQRDYPIDFAYPFEERYVVSVIIPEGYAVEELPVSTSLNLPNNAGKFEYKASHLSGKIQLMLTVLLYETTFSPDQYVDLKALFDQMVTKRSEQIVFKKISDK
ncbi:MAG: DUF3857 domain-containing protein [Saprospiraceae bacterium]|nr:DUF3857 domain-containing protein [Saprospiraceae bacterium]